MEATEKPLVKTKVRFYHIKKFAMTNEIFCLHTIFFGVFHEKYEDYGKYTKAIGVFN